MNLIDSGVKLSGTGTLDSTQFVKYRDHLEDNTINQSRKQFLEYELIKCGMELLPDTLLLWDRIKNLIVDLVLERQAVIDLQESMEAKR